MKRWLLFVPLFLAPLVPVVARLISGSAIPAPPSLRSNPAKGLIPVVATPVETTPKAAPEPGILNPPLVPPGIVETPVTLPEPEPAAIPRAEARFNPPPLEGALSKSPPSKPPRLMVGPDGVIFQSSQPTKPSR